MIKKAYQSCFFIFFLFMQTFLYPLSPIQKNRFCDIMDMELMGKDSDCADRLRSFFNTTKNHKEILEFLRAYKIRYREELILVAATKGLFATALELLPFLEDKLIEEAFIKAQQFAKISCNWFIASDAHNSLGNSYWIISYMLSLKKLSIFQLYSLFSLLLEESDDITFYTAALLAFKQVDGEIFLKTISSKKFNILDQLLHKEFIDSYYFLIQASEILSSNELIKNSEEDIIENETDERAEKNFEFIDLIKNSSTNQTDRERSYYKISNQEETVLESGSIDFLSLETEIKFDSEEDLPETLITIEEQEDILDYYVNKSYYNEVDVNNQELFDKKKSVAL